MDSARRPGLPGWLLPPASFALPLALYAATCCRSIWWMDATEFMLVGRHLGLSHPPGYPLLTLLVRVLSLAPVLSLPFRLNLVSALAAAGSCLFLFLSVRRLTSDAVAALAAALLWAVSFELWQQATALEAYALQALVVSLLIYAAAGWTTAAALPAGSRGPLPDLLLGCFAVGLALANHLFVVWLAPALLLLLFSGPWRGLRPRHILPGIGLLALGPLLYLYVPLRAAAGPEVYWGGVGSLRGVLEFLTGRVYRYRFLAGGTGYVAGQLGTLPLAAARQFLLGWLLAVPGVLWLWRRNRPLLLALAVAFTLVVAGALAYNIPDKDGYLLPAWFAAAALLGCGLAALRRTRAGRAVTLLAFASAAASVALFLPVQDRSRLRGLEDLSRAVAAEAGDTAAVFTDDYSIYMGLRWYGSLPGAGGGPVVVSEHHLAFPWYLDRLGRRLPVPAGCRAMAARLWSNAGRLSNAAFGEEAKAVTQAIRHELCRAWAPTLPLHWIPRDFSDWPEQWGDFRLELRGLTYRLLPAGDSAGPAAFDLHLPGPGEYRTTRFRDPATVDICRRFAAAVNRRGMLFFGADQSGRAIADFNLALDYYPDYPAAIENKGLVFAIAGQADSARLYLNRFLQLEPDSPEVPKVRQFLSRLP
ncbi:DUF2723 domain-containing protein [candidate division WOR-3 bacterium]|nr:DUF2723 domain-containing protein [candidate division WOR-3 bacterium]